MCVYFVSGGGHIISDINHVHWQPSRVLEGQDYTSVLRGSLLREGSRYQIGWIFGKAFQSIFSDEEGERTFKARNMWGMGCLSILEHIQGWGRCQDISGASLNLSEEIPHRTCLGLPNLGHPHLHLRANSSKAQHLYGCCQVLRKTLQTNEGYHKLWHQYTLM